MAAKPAGDECEEATVLSGIVGFAGGREVIIGFAPASVLHALSFADTLDEDTGRGYQRRFNADHSLDFRRYIQTAGGTTIPLTFNLRPRTDDGWRLVRTAGSGARLEIRRGAGKVLAQVDCQHRLGYLNDVNLSLPFMCFVGVSEREEMEIFNTINSKAKGLSTSLLDLHDARLANDLASERPELFIALHLNNDAGSVWYRQLDLGGASTSGLKRRASLRTMQKAIKRFLRQTHIVDKRTPEYAAQVVLDFWACIEVLLREAWSNPRTHLINKGVGVYSLMSVAADLYHDAEAAGQPCDKRFFMAALSEFIQDVDWSSRGPLGGLGGEAGVKAALGHVREIRSRRRLKVVTGGQ
jgi:DNA sulfur modification protein DndB